MRFSGVTRKVLSYLKHTLPCSCEHQVWSGSIYFERQKTYLAVFWRTQLQSFNSWFVNGGIAMAYANNMAVCQSCRQQGCIARMCACRIAGRSASRPVCGKYRIAVSLREGFFLLKKETDSRAIYALLSVWIFCFPSVGHLLYGYFICAGLKYASFFGSILSKNERKIVQKTVCRLNLQIPKSVCT